MLLKTRGNASNFDDVLVAKVSHDINKLDNNTFYLCENDYDIVDLKNCKGVLTNENIDIAKFSLPIVTGVGTLNHLNNGDIISVHPNGKINTLYRVNSHQNFIFTTERCNSNCLMCSQPPRDRNDIDYLFHIIKETIPLIPKDCFELGITGGEPTLMGSHFFSLIQLLKDNLPNTEFHLLTNGRSFGWDNIANQLGQIDNRRLMIGVPLYSDYYQIHDYIVQAKDAFYQTVKGLHNLAKYNQRVEIRIVLHKLTIARLSKLARFIYKNFPFAEHVTFMGLEYIGYTPHNIEKLWIDPYDYRFELDEAVEYLASQGMNVSIYNSQLCVLPENLWKYCKKSISDWKMDFLPECSKCNKLDACGGLFTWNLQKHSNYIHPIVS